MTTDDPEIEFGLELIRQCPALLQLTPDTGLLNEEQSKRFVDLVTSKEQMRACEECRLVCMRCGVSWPWLAPELSCTCAPNEIRDHLRKHAWYRRLSHPWEEDNGM